MHAAEQMLLLQTSLCNAVALLQDVLHHTCSYTDLQHTWVLSGIAFTASYAFVISLHRFPAQAYYICG